MSVLDRLRAVFSDRRRVLIGAAVVGGGLGLLAIARRSGAGAAAVGAKQDASSIDPMGIPTTPYTSFGGVDNSMADSANAEAIVGQIGVLDNTVGGVLGALAGITSTIEGLTSNVQGLAQLVNDNPRPAPPAAVAPKAPTKKTTAPKSKPPASPPPRQNIPPAGSTGKHFQRSQAIAWKSLYMPTVKGGKVSGWKAVKLSELSDEEIVRALGYAKNQGALNPNWKRASNGSVVRR